MSDREGAVGFQEAAARSVDLPDGRIRPERDRGARPGERGRRRGLREGGGELDEKDEREDEDDRDTPRTKGRVADLPRETAGPLGGSGSGELGCGRRHIRLLARIVPRRGGPSLAGYSARIRVAWRIPFWKIRV